MPAQRVSMRKIREVLRLRNTTELSKRQIGRAVGIGATAVGEYIGRAIAAGVPWPVPEEIDDAELERRLFPAQLPSSTLREMPDLERVHRELRRKGVTRMILWQEYKLTHPDGYNYSRFCDLYREWQGMLDMPMRQRHTPGERMFVDYTGMTMPIIDATTGEVRAAEIFAANIGASSFVYCEATESQSTTDFIGAHVRCFDAIGGVPQIVVCDNLKTGVTKAHRYDPIVNRGYSEMADHYGVAIIPARAYKPRDKAKVESTVQVVEQSILAPLRDRNFFSLAELNAAIAPLLIALNDRPFQKQPGSRRSVFEELDRPALRSLPPSRFELAEWKKARVNIDYHIDVLGHYYSVPYKYVRAQLDVRITATSVECFDGRSRIASHMRDHRRGQHTTLSEHMPEKHRRYAECTPELITQWAARIGEAMTQLLARIVESRAHPEQGYRTCLGILRLSKVYGDERLESAARHALAIGSKTYPSVESILKNGIDLRPNDRHALTHAPLVTHDNIRGPQYYGQPVEPHDMETDQC